MFAAIYQNEASNLTDIEMVEIATELNAVESDDAAVDQWLGARSAHLAERNYENENFNAWMAEIEAERAAA